MFIEFVFKKREPIVVAASNVFEACERVMKVSSS